MNAKTRDEAVEALIQFDIDTVKRDLTYDNYSEFLRSVLSGEGWVPYNQLTDEEVMEEYEDRWANYPDEMKTIEENI
jgi:hypothetical protein